MRKIPIALQLYSLREMAAQDLLHVLEKAAELGYTGVEFAGFFDHSSTVIREKLNELGLTPVSSHVGYDLLVNALDQVIEFHQAIGTKTLVCPAPPQGHQVTDKAAWQRLGASLNTIGQQCQIAGMRLGYHNHSWEFTKLTDGAYPLDVLLAEADPDNLFAQLDLGWTLYAGVNPVERLRQYSDRCPLVHVKDFRQGKQVEVGTGELDLCKVWQEAQAADLECVILETEEYTMEPVESVKVGLENLLNSRC